MYNNLLSYAVSNTDGSINVEATLQAVRNDLTDAAELQKALVPAVGPVVETHFRGASRITFKNLVKEVQAALPDFQPSDIQVAVAIYVKSPRFKSIRGAKGGIQRVSNLETVSVPQIEETVTEASPLEEVPETQAQDTDFQALETEFS